MFIFISIIFFSFGVNYHLFLVSHLMMHMFSFKNVSQFGKIDFGESARTTYTRFEIPRWLEKWTNQNNQCYIEVLIFATKPASVRQIGELFSASNERKRNEYAILSFDSKLELKSE